MAYAPANFPVLVLKRPISAAASSIAFGLLGGIAAAALWNGHNLFERFGAVTTALGILTFGAMASELLVRSQGSFIMGDDGEPGAPFNFATVRSALSWQTFVVLIGTMQWGFGALIFVR